MRAHNSAGSVYHTACFRVLFLVFACLGLPATLAEVAWAQNDIAPWQSSPGNYDSRAYPNRGGTVHRTAMVEPISGDLQGEDPRGIVDQGGESVYAAEGGLPAADEYGCEVPQGRGCTTGHCGEVRGLQGRLWFRGDYLMWWTKGAHLPPLASTGVIGQNGTQVLFGGNEVDPGLRDGGRFTATYWTCPMQDVGIEASYLFLGRKAADYFNSNPGTSNLARPFIDATAGSLLFGQENALFVAQTGILSGNLDIQTGNDLQIAELLVRRALIQDCDLRVDLLAGYRYGHFAENLSIRSQSRVLSGGQLLPIDTVIDRADYFSSGNEFNGAEIGLSAQRQRLRWGWDAYAKLALGQTRSRVGIAGETMVAQPGLPVDITPNGLLTQSSNIGRYEERNFTAMPEVGFNLSYDLTCRLKARLGYSLLYWSKVARPADEVNLAVNRAQPAGLAAPAFRFNTNDFWAQGLNFGLDYSY